MTLGNEQDPIIMIWEEEGKSKWEDGVEDNKVVVDLNNGAAWHISRDRACTQIEVTQLDVVCGQKEGILEGTQPRRGET